MTTSLPCTVRASQTHPPQAGRTPKGATTLTLAPVPGRCRAAGPGSVSPTSLPRHPADQAGPGPTVELSCPTEAAHGAQATDWCVTHCDQGAEPAGPDLFSPPSLPRHLLPRRLQGSPGLRDGQLMDSQAKACTQDGSDGFLFVCLFCFRVINQTMSCSWPLLLSLHDQGDTFPWVMWLLSSGMALLVLGRRSPLPA